MLSRQFVRKVVYGLKGELEEKKFKDLTSHYDIGGYKRIYFVHIRKTGGTSLNFMFLSLSGMDSGKVYKHIIDAPRHRFLHKDKVFVGWNRRYINKGNYFYAFSHLPFHKLNLPEQTYTLTCFRDPVKRVISLYNMLMDFSLNNVDRPCMKIEGKWLGNSFDDFIERISKDQLLNQLYMFSENYDIDEAVENVQTLSYYFFTENFQESIDVINQQTGLSLEPLHTRKASRKAPISDQSKQRLREMLDVEYTFLDRLRKL